MSGAGACRGVVAAGHQITAEAARGVLTDGGNAFDAVLAAMLAACVAEPVLASLGGGGFLLAHAADEPPAVFDFFVQTPHRRRPLEDIDFRPILADFGTAQQEFHIGMGTIATPGIVAGLFAIHEALCTLPLERIAEPAIRAARDGITVNGFQHYISTIVAPILESSPDALALHATAQKPESLAAEGDRLYNVALGDTLDTLTREGPGLFYLGEIGQRIVHDCAARGGWLGHTDLSAYEVVRRRPLQMSYRGHQLFLNPPPSVGGTLLAFCLGLLDTLPVPPGSNGEQNLTALAEAMAQTQYARCRQGIDDGLDLALAQRLLDAQSLAEYRSAIRDALSSRGTTHISVADRAGNLASLTLSNGEGSGYVVPGTGIMLNNMLGEEDLNARGFHRWRTDHRVASMMSPTLAGATNGDRYAIGSGGSNRIRSAILQTLLPLLDTRCDIGEAVCRPRIHVENEVLNLEAGLADSTLEQLRKRFPTCHQWPGINLFFGGAHSVVRHVDGRLSGAGDPRRGGIALFA